MTNLPALTRDELVAWFRAEIDKADASGDPEPFDAEAFKAERRRKHGPSTKRPSINI